MRIHYTKTIEERNEVDAEDIVNGFKIVGEVIGQDELDHGTFSGAGSHETGT